jgi:hypothetical protein
MISLFPMLAQLDPDDPTAATKYFAGSQFYQILIVLGSMLVVAVIAAILAVRFSNRKHGHKHHHRRSSRKKTGAASQEGGDGSGGKHIQRSQRKMNPTLAETRGLPPVRDPDSAPPLP